MKIRTFGDGGRQRECERRLGACDMYSPYRELILLPIPTSRDGVRISGTDIMLADVVQSASEGAFVAGYNIPEPFADGFISRRACVYDAGFDERFLCANADLTARGALGRILCDLQKDVTELRIAIIGYGRIGSRLMRYLLFLGAHVTVYTGREKNCISLACDGVDARSLFDPLELLSFDLIINTAPAPLIPESVVREMTSETCIMDLASGSFVPKHSSFVKLSSIPDTMYPVSAGRLYAEYIAEYLFLKGGEDRLS